MKRARPDVVDLLSVASVQDLRKLREASVRSEQHKREQRKECFVAWARLINENLIAKCKYATRTDKAQLVIYGNELLNVVPAGMDLREIPICYIEEFAVQFTEVNRDYGISLEDSHKEDCTCASQAKACWRKLRVTWEWEPTEVVTHSLMECL